MKLPKFNELRAGQAILVLAASVLVLFLSCVVPGFFMLAVFLFAIFYSYGKMQNSEGKSKAFWTTVFVLSIVCAIILCMGSTFYVGYAFLSQ